jgi:hypothetical protein
MGVKKHKNLIKTPAVAGTAFICLVLAVSATFPALANEAG